MGKKAANKKAKNTNDSSAGVAADPASTKVKKEKNIAESSVKVEQSDKNAVT
jgi:hypothetical protein